MSFYIVCELLTCFGYFSGVYRSFKILKRLHHEREHRIPDQSPLASPSHQQSQERNDAVLAERDSPSTVLNQQTRLLLMYWSILGALQLLEAYAEFIISWFPFYYFGKAIVLAIIVLPQTKVAAVVFEGFLVPFVDMQQDYVLNKLLPGIFTTLSRVGRSTQRIAIKVLTPIVPLQGLYDIETELLLRHDIVQKEIAKRRQRREQARKQQVEYEHLPELLEEEK